MKWIKTHCKTILNRTSLWVQLTLFMVLITTLVSVYLIHKDYTSTRTLTINNQIDTTQTILKLEVENLDNYLSELANFCIQPYYDSRFTRIVEQDGPLTQEQISYAKQQMYYYYYTRSDILDYELYLLHQNLSVGRTGSEQHFTSKDTEPEGAAEALNECEQSPLNRSMKTNDSANLIYYHSLFQIKGKVRQAVVRLELNNSYAKPLLENHAAHGEMIAFFNEKGELLFSNRPDAFPEDCSYMTLVSQKKQQADGYSTIELSEEPFLCVEAESPSSGISLVSLTPLSYIDSQIGQLRSSIIVSGIWVWLITVVMIYMLLRLLTIPLKMLSAQMQRTGEGDFRTQIHAAGSLEIRHLSDSFNSMVAHIDQLIRRTYVAELSEKDARLSALEAQLNPHFLYNTLQAISTEALVNDQPRIHKMITALASNLRYTIKGDTLVTLEREMNYVNDYIFLQKIRMDDSLDFSADIDPETLDCLIPKISIQTLVENSIIHGKSGSIETIRIEVSARYHDGSVTITVQDNGCGIAEEELAKLYADFDRQENTGKYGGIGLANLHSRLKLLYDKPASLGIETKEAEYTRITLLLPALKIGNCETGIQRPYERSKMQQEWIQQRQM